MALMPYIFGMEDIFLLIINYNVVFVVIYVMHGTGVFKMPPKRLLSHYKVDAQRRRLIVMACNAEDMVLPRSHYTFYGTQNFIIHCCSLSLLEHRTKIEIGLLVSYILRAFALI